MYLARKSVCQQRIYLSTYIKMPGNRLQKQPFKESLWMWMDSFCMQFSPNTVNSIPQKNAKSITVCGNTVLNPKE